MTVDALLRRAIEEKRLVGFVYDGRSRIGEPHDYGLRNGKAQLNFYQKAGETKSGRLPSWRTMDVDDISQLRVLDETFAGTRATPTGRHLEWDEVFASVTLRASSKSGGRRARPR